jgi:hypothetical protein
VSLILIAVAAQVVSLRLIALAAFGGLALIGVVVAVVLMWGRRPPADD